MRAHQPLRRSPFPGHGLGAGLQCQCSLDGLWGWSLPAGLDLTKLLLLLHLHLLIHAPYTDEFDSMLAVHAHDSEHCGYAGSVKEAHPLLAIGGYKFEHRSYAGLHRVQRHEGTHIQHVKGYMTIDR